MLVLAVVYAQAVPAAAALLARVPQHPVALAPHKMAVVVQVLHLSSHHLHIFLVADISAHIPGTALHRATVAVPEADTESSSHIGTPAAADIVLAVGQPQAPAVRVTVVPRHERQSVDAGPLQVLQDLWQC